MDCLAQKYGKDLNTATHQQIRYALRITGLVQGVGFRPFVYHLAKEYALGGFILNTSSGVDIEVEGDNHDVLQFTLRLSREAPALSHIEFLECHVIPVVGTKSFSIQSSMIDEVKSPWLLPDLALCPDCREELYEPRNRRYQYPFINCTQCGPRYSILHRLPYDRPNTTMDRFPMCPDCAEEYHDPYNRRFHAQPIACPNCGPHLELWDKKGAVLATHAVALDSAVACIQSGRVLALKGLGGYHLMVDATNAGAIEVLR